MEIDLLRYSGTQLDVCTKNWTRRQLHDLIRQVMIYSKRIRVCSCIEDRWVRDTLQFLNVEWNNESCKNNRPESDRECVIDTSQPTE